MWHVREFQAFNPKWQVHASSQSVSIYVLSIIIILYKFGNTSCNYALGQTYKMNGRGKRSRYVMLTYIWVTILHHPYMNPQPILIILVAVNLIIWNLDSEQGFLYDRGHLNWIGVSRPVSCHYYAVLGCDRGETSGSVSLTVTYFW